jgi:hypothetical protein
MYHQKYLFLFLVIVIAGCSPRSQKGKASDSAELKPESAHAGAAAPPASTADLKFTPPSGWIAEKPSSTSRKAQFKIPRTEGDPEDAELVVYYFQGGGGTPQANVDRWISQFTGPDGKPVSNAKISHKMVGSIPLTVVDVSGTYSGSMGAMQSGGSTQPGFRMLGAIAETTSGPWFVKLTGPARTVAKWEPGFQSFLDSMRQGS